MAPLKLAQNEWEDKTTPHPKSHPVDKGGKKVHLHEFRKFGQAIAWLKWEGEYIEIAKFEKLPGGCRYAGTQLIEFLKMLSAKYEVRLFGNPVVYQPTPPVPDGPYPSQERLEIWYEKLGFKIQKSAEFPYPMMWYPDVPNAEKKNTL